MGVGGVGESMEYGRGLVREDSEFIFPKYSHVFHTSQPRMSNFFVFKLLSNIFILACCYCFLWIVLRRYFFYLLSQDL